MSVIERHLRPRVVEALDDTRVIVVLGARQVGKSTLVQAVAARDRRSVSVIRSSVLHAPGSMPWL